MTNTPSPNRLLHNRYQIEELLGAGGFGRVYRAQDHVLMKIVAIKELIINDPQFVRLFEREARLLANLRHMALPGVTDHFIDNSIPYLVMEYVHGQDISDLLGSQVNKRLNEAYALGVMRPVFDAVQYMHTQPSPVIHRDIKPNNIRISPNGHVCLVDFGLAKITTNDPTVSTGIIGVTPGFSPPEQYSRQAEPRSDIYALGATLYQMLTGVCPPDSLQRTIRDSLQPARKLNPEISPRTSQIVEKMLALRIEDRPATVSDVMRDLYQQNTPKRRFMPWMLAAGGGALATLTVCVALVFIVTLNQPKPVQPTTPPALDSVPTTSNFTSLEVTPAAVIAHNDDGKPAAQDGNVVLRDFDISVRFQNPYLVTDDHIWDYGLMFRYVGPSQRYMIWVDAKKRWSLWIQDASGLHSLDSGDVSNLNVDATGNNKLRFIAIGNKGYLLINDVLVHDKPLDLSANTVAGDIKLTTGFVTTAGPEIAGRATGYNDFTLLTDSEEAKQQVALMLLKTTRTSWKQVINDGFDTDSNRPYQGL